MPWISSLRFSPYFLNSCDISSLSSFGITSARVIYASSANYYLPLSFLIRSKNFRLSSFRSISTTFVVSYLDSSTFSVSGSPDATVFSKLACEAKIESTGSCLLSTSVGAPPGIPGRCGFGGFARAHINRFNPWKKSLSLFNLKANKIASVSLFSRRSFDRFYSSSRRPSFSYLSAASYSIVLSNQRFTVESAPPVMSSAVSSCSFKSIAQILSLCISNVF